MAMARRSRKDNPELLRGKLVELLQGFEHTLKTSDLRRQVQELVPAYHFLRDIGSSLMDGPGTDSGRDRILEYFKRHAGQVLNGAELMVVAGINEYPRRIRELRLEYGWPILSGVTLAEIREAGGEEAESLPQMKPDDYVMTSAERNEDAAERWRVGNQIRKEKIGVKPKILKYMLANLGKEVSGEELRYVANDKSEWARRVRELRTEEGWRITTKTTGRPTLPVGVYVLESAEQAPVHDRQIPDPVRYAAMQRDDYSCIDCKWDSRKDWSASAPRHLELHHIIPHVEGGKNTVENLVTLCNICHDERHRRGEK
jgi:hypothetical protein